jgi:hypothetical protein
MKLRTDNALRMYGAMVKLVATITMIAIPGMPSSG